MIEIIFNYNKKMLIFHVVNSSLARRDNKIKLSKKKKKVQSSLSTNLYHYENDSAHRE